MGAKEKPYIKNQKDPGGSKYLCAQDEQDFEQEQLIKQWLEREGCVEEFDFKHINRKGAARNTLDTKSVRLDAKVSDESGSRTYADIIAGSDGRDLVGRDDADEVEFNASEEFTKRLGWLLETLNVKEGTKTWATETLLKNAKKLNLSKQVERPRDETRSNLSIPNLGSPRRLATFRRL